MIGIFDSGIGGLSVLKAIREKMPLADIVYFGDTENAPYGNKSAREISELIAMALTRLHAEGCTDIVSACNSASVSVHSIPIDLLRMNLFNVVEMVEPTVLALASKKKKIVLFGTAATIRSGIYQQGFAQQGISIETVALADLAGAIEEGASSKELQKIIQPAVQEALQMGGELLSLSCTHYPFARKEFAHAIEECGSDAELFDPAGAVANEVAKRFSPRGEGKMKFLVSKKTPVFSQYVAQLFEENYDVEEAGSIYWALQR